MWSVSAENLQTSVKDVGLDPLLWTWGVRDPLTSIRQDQRHPADMGVEEIQAALSH